MCGWFNEAAVCASRKNRDERQRHQVADSNLMATGRFTSCRSRGRRHPSARAEGGRTDTHRCYGHRFDEPGMMVCTAIIAPKAADGCAYGRAETLAAARGLHLAESAGTCGISASAAENENR